MESTARQRWRHIDGYTCIQFSIATSSQIYLIPSTIHILHCCNCFQTRANACTWDKTKLGSAIICKYIISMDKHTHTLISRTQNHCALYDERTSYSVPVVDYILFMNSFDAFDFSKNCFRFILIFLCERSAFCLHSQSMADGAETKPFLFLFKMNGEARWWSCDHYLPFKFWNMHSEFRINGFVGNH